MSNRIGIAVSGKSGCGNTTVSKLLAHRLGFSFINYTFRSMAEEMNISFDRLRELAEESDDYDKQLDATQLSLARKGNCVLGSRLAVWLFEEAVLKVYLYASPQVRSSRILQREGGSYEDLYAVTQKRDHADQARYSRIYGINTEDYHHVDLVINAGNFTPAEKIVDIIMAALTAKGYGFPHMDSQGTTD
ncbi:MAG: cytidylate kinase family protein [Spirochaetales bacterium]|nr:cytidylate kinase family protein [Spirochaetales bacterium]